MRLDALKFTADEWGDILIENEYFSDTPEKRYSTRVKGEILLGTGQPMFRTNPPGVFGMNVLSIEDLEAIVAKMKEIQS